MSYAAPTRYHPNWHAASLVYQGGNPRLPAQSLTGAGKIFARGASATFQPVIWAQSGVTQSLVGSGILPIRPVFLTALLQQNTTVTAATSSNGV